MSNHTPNVVDIGKLAQEGINKRLTEIAEEEFELAKKRIEERKAEIVMGVVLKVEEYVSYERLGSTIRIEIRDIK